MITRDKTSGKSIKSFFSAVWNKIKNFFTYNLPDKSPRIWELDVIRGLLMLAVTLDHVCVFIFRLGIIPFQTALGHKIFEIAGWYHECDFRHAIQPFALFFFCFLAGINSQFTRSGLRRVLKFWIICGLYMGGFALLSYVVPNLFYNHFAFNIIPVLTICFTIWWLLELIKCPYWVRSGIGIVLICIGLTCYYLHFIKGYFYIQNDFLALMVYNYHGAYELSLDNFEPLLPHLGWFIVGGVVGRFAYANKKTYCKQVYPPKYLYPVLIMGKHSLFFYLIGPAFILTPLLIISNIIALFH